MLINGALDDGLKECGILLEDNTLNTQMWKKSAEIASHEKKISKGAKNSLKRYYDQQGREQVKLNAYVQ